jgi:zinc transporter ZupT
MLGFAETLGATLGSFLIPTVIGLLIVSAAANFVSQRYLAAFGLGLYFWFFSDTIGDANLLGVNEGFTGGVFHLALVVVFAVGIIAIFSLDNGIFAAPSSGRRVPDLGFGIPILVAIAVGVHGFGEGAAIGSTAATTPSTSLVDAFGGLSSAVAFVLHKALEPMMVGIAYWVYARGHATDTSGRLRDIVVLALAFTLPGIVGSSLAYYLVQVYPGADFTYVFALGLGTSIYAALRLARPLFQGDGTRSESLKTVLAILIGFLCLYLAALLHS